MTLEVRAPWLEDAEAVAQVCRATRLYEKSMT
jgi:hypothetical protein